jgi:hypothetical protein
MHGKEPTVASEGEDGWPSEAVLTKWSNKSALLKKTEQFSPMIPGRGKRMFSSPSHADQLWDVTKSCSVGARICLSGIKWPRREATHPHIASRLKTHEALPQLPNLP